MTRGTARGAWDDGRVTAVDDMRAAIHAAGYFPELAHDCMVQALGDEDLREWFVQQEAILTHDSVQRHLTVLALTATRVVVGHTDETEDPFRRGGAQLAGRAASTTESVSLGNVNAVALSRVVANAGDRQHETVESWLTWGWGVLRQLDLQPASCADPQCEADHGYSGTLASDDITIRVSRDADGAQAVEQLLRFGTALQQATRG